MKPKILILTTLNKNIFIGKCLIKENAKPFIIAEAGFKS